MKRVKAVSEAGGIPYKTAVKCAKVTKVTEKSNIIAKVTESGFLPDPPLDSQEPAFPAQKVTKSDEK